MSEGLIAFFSKCTWYWITLFLAAIAAVTILIIPANFFPLTYLRSLLSIILIMFLPGFVLMKSLFLYKLPIKTLSTKMELLEKIVFSVGLSLIIAPLIGLVLNSTPWGVRLTPITFSLVAFIIILATFAMFREFNQFKINNKNRSP